MNKLAQVSSVWRPFWCSRLCLDSTPHLPITVREVQDIVRKSTRLRAVGAGHTTSDLQCTRGDLVIVQNNFCYFRDLDSANVATFGAGCQVKQALDILSKRGFQLKGTPYVTDHTIGGAISISSVASVAARREAAPPGRAAPSTKKKNVAVLRLQGPRLMLLRHPLRANGIEAQKHQIASEAEAPRGRLCARPLFEPLGFRRFHPHARHSALHADSHRKRARLLPDRLASRRHHVSQFWQGTQAALPETPVNEREAEGRCVGCGRNVAAGQTCATCGKTRPAQTEAQVK